MSSSFVIIFSPSKKQNIRLLQPVTQPAFADKADYLYQQLRGLGVLQIGNRFKVSESIAQKLHDSYQQKDGVMGNVLASFTGTSFSRLAVDNFKKEEWDFVQRHLFILSGLYGILKPLDAMCEYRLDFADTVSWMKGVDNLYEYWKDEVNQQLNSVDIILNLASTEYSKILSNKNQQNMIMVDFLVLKNGAYTTVSVYSKQQRGSMLNFIIKNKITSVGALKAYSNDGFVFDGGKSKEGRLVFVKKVLG